MQRHEPEEENENAKRLKSLCSFNNMAVGDSIFYNASENKVTCISLDNISEFQNIHIFVNQKTRISAEAGEPNREANMARNHNLVLGLAKTEVKEILYS
ncbi:unnamed protein product [Schistosoma mattheei]|uniref:Uncharacterized protein n=1 Tax=Schistosoma mattheei TaxID=31246 RepID=A0A183PHA1_9TREM|nr:unnamed protein product [Schistosoma mattheei]